MNLTFIFAEIEIATGKRKKSDPLIGTQSLQKRMKYNPPSIKKKK